MWCFSVAFSTYCTVHSLLSPAHSYLPGVISPRHASLLWMMWSPVSPRREAAPVVFVCLFFFWQKHFTQLIWKYHKLLFLCLRQKKKRFKYISINNWGYSLVNHSLCTVLLILITWQLTGVHFTYVGMICFHIASFWPCHSINIVLVSMDGEWQIGREQRWAGPGAAVHMRMKGSVYSD